MNNNFMSRTLFSIILAITLLMGTLVILQAKPSSPTQEIQQEETNPHILEGVSLIQANDNGISFILNTSDVEYSAEGAFSSKALNVVTQEPGSPELPYFSTYIAIPPEAGVSIDVFQKETSRLTDISVLAAPEPTLSFSNSDPDSPFPVTAVSPKTISRIPNPAIYATDTLYPNKTYTLSDPVYYRDMRLVKLDLYPLQYNPVQEEVQQTQQMQVNIRFEGAQLDNLQPAPSKDDTYQSSMSSMILNFEQSKAWRSLPLSGQNLQVNSLTETAVSLPLGTESYKIEINQDGIYDITGADLAAANMNIASINPATIEMMSRGESIGYTFIKKGTNQNVLEDTDIIRFYGEGVNGSRREKQFLTHNVYWLWPNGVPTPITTEANSPSGETVTSFTDSITREDEIRFFSTWTNLWDQAPNEADSWYWDLMTSPATKAYTVDLPDPLIESGQTAAYTVEVLSRHDYRTVLNYQVDVCLNSYAACAQKTWTNNRNYDVKNFNITATVPMTALVTGDNTFSLTLSNPGNVSTVRAYLNRITVAYQRILRAENDHLFFTDEMGGRGMVVQDFSENDPNKILVWDISTPTNPTQIASNTIGISEHNGRYTYTIGIDSSTAQNYIATTEANTLTPGNISQYTPPANLEPASGADWVAISYGDFIPQANILATHRGQPKYGNLKTYVIDIEDVINVYGDGLPMPEAIHTYLEKSLTWTTKPSYVVLVGDGVVSPRNLQCAYNCYPDWDKDAQNFIPTDMQFKDRYQGLIPSDNTAVFLVGDDLLADMAIGRLTAETSAEAKAMVDKIIKFEENLYTRSQNQEPERVLFLADFPDLGAGGSFCNTNKNLTGALLPADYEQIHLCIEDFTVPDLGNFDPTTFTDAIVNETNAGVSLMNYRGHGTIEAWGGPSFWWVSGNEGDPPTYVHKSNQQLKNIWANEGKPAIVLSADCLDGHFAWPGHPALSERFLGLDDMAGSAAHWSSAGLGLDHEHTTLLEGFYQGLFDHGQFRIGDAINYAKLHFSLSNNYSESEMYSFNLQGDPAMQVILPEYNVFLPLITN